MNAMDAILHELTPVLPVPGFEGLALDDRAQGHRFLVAADGLWIEATTPWLRARAAIARSPMRLPFGELSPRMQLRCGPLPKALLERFIARAREASPDEVAAIVTWQPATGEFRLRMLEGEASPSRVRYERPRLDDGEFLIADLHSHGDYPAGFSKQDDADDAGEIKIAVVAGRCSSSEPEIAARLCLLGVFMPMEACHEA